jgi:hypothetical protein
MTIKTLYNMLGKDEKKTQKKIMQLTALLWRDFTRLVGCSSFLLL